MGGGRGPMGRPPPFPRVRMCLFVLLVCSCSGGRVAQRYDIFISHLTFSFSHTLFCTIISFASHELICMISTCNSFCHAWMPTLPRSCRQEYSPHAHANHSALGTSNFFSSANVRRVEYLGFTKLDMTILFVGQGRSPWGL